MRILLMSIFLFLRCVSAHAVEEEFPPQVRGFWAEEQETCTVLKTSSPADLHNGQRWLKITATDILGATQSRLLRKIPAQMAGGARAKLSFEFQKADLFGLVGRLDFHEQGHGLYETIVGARKSRYYFQC